MRRYRIADIRAANIAAGRFFFSRATMKFFGDRVSDWGVVHITGSVFSRVFIHHKTRVEVREFVPQTGHIGLPIEPNGTHVDVGSLRDWIDHKEPLL